MRVSVVICTLDRAAALGATLECLRHQHHDDFEVIVVNGPSTDNTLEVVAPWRDRIRYCENPARNLSISRNIGIRAASGDLIAFIDDDALPEPEWLTQAIPAFDDPEVAGAGGIVFDHTGMGLQYRYAATSRLLQTVFSDHDHAAQCFPGTFQFPYLQGTNQVYRRGPLLAVGGFDEHIYFYGDDCDISGRLIDAGWVIRQLALSAVHHKYLPSGIRDHQRITTNWFPVVHDHTYFSLRHAAPYLSEDEILHSVYDFMITRVADTRLHEAAGRLESGSTTSAEATCLRAFAAGLADGREVADAALPPIVPDDVDFLPFETLGGSWRRKLLFISSSYTGNLTGGIGRLISDLAPAMARRGHDVRVITRATAPAAVDFEDGVWVHRVETPPLPPGTGVAPDLTEPINSFSTVALHETERLRGWVEPDLVFGPLWDVEAIGVLRNTDLPMALHVSTPLAVIGPMAGFIRHDGSDAPQLRRLLEVEQEMMENADLFQANTDAVVDTIRSNYDQTCGADRWRVVNIGLRDQSFADVDGGGTSTHSGTRRIFFAGRFEARKGIDTLLAAMERVLPDHPDVELVLAGEDRPLVPGAQPFGWSWRRQHRGEPWLDRVQMLGVVDDETLHRQYAEAEIVVLPSRYESFGLVMVEAMMHAKPLVSTDTSGVREVVRHGVDGLLVEPGNDAELEQAIRALLDDRDYAAALGTAARERFDAHLSIERLAERFERFCQQIVSSPAAQRGSGEMAVLTEGASTTIELHGHRAATVVLRAQAPSCVVIVDARRQAIKVAAGEHRRVRLDVASGRAKISVVEGEIAVERLITVESADG